MPRATGYPTVTEFDKPTTRALGEAIARAVQEQFGPDTGVDFKYGGGMLDGTDCTIRLRCRVRDATPREAVLFQELAALGYGLKPEDLGRSFAANGKRFVVKGLLPGRAKPIICDDLAGKRFVFTARSVQQALAREDETPS